MLENFYVFSQQSDANQTLAHSAQIQAFGLQDIFHREEESEDGVRPFIEYGNAAMKPDFMEIYSLDDLTKPMPRDRFVRELKAILDANFR